MKQKTVAAPVKAAKKAAPVVEMKDPNRGATRIAPVKPKAKWQDIDFAEILNNHKTKTQVMDRVREKSKKLEVFKETITPDAALDILKTNLDINRNLNKFTVFQYAEDMIEGRWSPNGDTIRFRKDDRVFDGQHRLWAIYLSGVAQVYFIVTGLADDAIETVDIGKGRTGGDTLKIQGINSHPNEVAAAIRSYLLYKFNGQVQSRSSQTFKVTNQAIRKWVKENPEWAVKLDEFSKFASTHLYKDGPFFKRSQWLFIYFILWTGNGCQKLAKEFVERLSAGEGISRQDNAAIFYLRKELEALDKQTKSANSGTMFTFKMRHVQQAWNAWAKGEHFTGFKFTKDENLSKIIGRFYQK